MNKLTSWKQKVLAMPTGQEFTVREIVGRVHSALLRWLMVMVGKARKDGCVLQYNKSKQCFWWEPLDGAHVYAPVSPLLKPGAKAQQDLEM